jgi:hypothetical protein
MRRGSTDTIRLRVGKKLFDDSRRLLVAVLNVRPIVLKHTFRISACLEIGDPWQLAPQRSAPVVELQIACIYER